ncbi:MAG: hypothetical protein L6R41_008034 [Letrouitia leprolyta]|nr:MAG: hypothetical protein L6R41_008034 [Letrouitia leprolyta]
MQRRDEILAKKAKLAELRRQRDEREKKARELSNRGVTGEPFEETVATPPSRSIDRKDLDNIIDDILGDRRSSQVGISSPSTRKNRPTSTAADVTKAEHDTVTEAPQAQTTSIATQTLSTVPAVVSYEFLPTPTPAPEVISYSKAIQTSDFGSPGRKDSRRGFHDSDSDDSPSLDRSPRKSKRRSRREREREETLRQNLRKEIEEELSAAKKPVSDVATTEARYPARPLTNEELTAVTVSEDFLDFVERSSKVIERALDQDYNVLADYSLDGVVGVDSDEEEITGRGRSKKGRRIRQVAQFYDERWCKKRMISDIDFSSRFPELLLASYTKNVSAPADPSGLLQVWNLHLHSRPEYTFHSTSDILTAQFSPFHPSLLIGGSYSGQILLWDTRSRSKMPSQKTPLTGAANGGHTHPIYSIAMVGTQNANNIVSCSTDGVVCSWTTDMLSQPQEFLTLTAPPPNKTEDLSPLCMAFPPADPTSFLVGTEEGTIYPCHRYDRAGAGAGTDIRLRFKGHTAPVTSLNFHPARGPIDFGDLFLSTGLDWSIKLWKSRPASSTSTAGSIAPGPNSEIVEPLLDIAREDIVYDAKWAPQKPGVFAAVDGAGSLELWDLTVDMEVPVGQTSPEQNKQVTGGAAFAAKSLNKVAWEEKEGKRLATGGAAGVVSVFEVGSALSSEHVRTEEWTAVKRLVGRLARRGGR